ncbi:hypothetical protein AGMMS50230_07170 [Spirochaetia bacterium]|nr:hypothetical protein AGMMS50230_07170 [Spirochaetia bacterium]
MRWKISAFFLLSALWCFAEDTGDKDGSIIPMAAYEFISFEGRQYHVPGGGLVLMVGDQAPPVEKERNSFMLAAFYRSYLLNAYLLNENQSGYPNRYHHVTAMAERKIRRHQVLGIFRSLSDEPVSGGLQTFQAALGYGYELVRNNSLSLTLGMALGLSEFEIGGKSVPVFPFPLVRLGFTSSWIHLSFDFLTNPALDIIIAPENKIRLNGSFQMVYYRDIQDLLFDCTLWYRFFTKEHKMGDFAGVGVGVKNSGEDFKLSEKGKTYEIGSYSVFGVIDLSFLEISGGYIFNSRERYDNNKAQSLGSGYFVSARLAWQF